MDQVKQNKLKSQTSPRRKRLRRHIIKPFEGTLPAFLPCEFANVMVEGFKGFTNHLVGAYEGTQSAIAVSISRGEVVIRLTAQPPEPASPAKSE